MCESILVQKEEDRMRAKKSEQIANFLDDENSARKNDLDLNVVCIAHILAPCPEWSRVNRAHTHTHTPFERCESWTLMLPAKWDVFRSRNCTQQEYCICNTLSLRCGSVVWEKKVKEWAKRASHSRSLACSLGIATKAQPKEKRISNDKNITFIFCAQWSWAMSETKFLIYNSIFFSTFIYFSVKLKERMAGKLFLMLLLFFFLCISFCCYYHHSIECVCGNPQFLDFFPANNVFEWSMFRCSFSELDERKNKFSLSVCVCCFFCLLSLVLFFAWKSDHLRHGYDSFILFSTF